MEGDKRSTRNKNPLYKHPKTRLGRTSQTTDEHLPAERRKRNKPAAQSNVLDDRMPPAKKANVNQPQEPTANLGKGAKIKDAPRKHDYKMRKRTDDLPQGRTAMKTSEEVPEFAEHVPNQDQTASLSKGLQVDVGCEGRSTLVDSNLADEPEQLLAKNPVETEQMVTKESDDAEQMLTNERTEADEPEGTVTFEPEKTMTKGPVEPSQEKDGKKDAGPTAAVTQFETDKNEVPDTVDVDNVGGGDQSTSSSSSSSSTPHLSVTERRVLYFQEQRSFWISYSKEKEEKLNERKEPVSQEKRTERGERCQTKVVVLPQVLEYYENLDQLAGNTKTPEN